MSTLSQVSQECSDFRHTVGLRGNPNCFRTTGPWDPDVGVDTTVVMFDGFPFKCAFAFSVFYVFFL